ncbi:MAG: ABC transporter permease [Actinomycetota bacterium]
MTAVVARRTAPPWLRRTGSQFLNVWALVGFAFLFAPIFVIVLFSFNDPVGRFNLKWQRFTLDNWTDPFRDRSLNDALWRSVQIAAIAMVVSTILGALIALALVRYRFRGGAIVNLLLVLPLTTPEIVLGASLLYFFVDRGQERGFLTIALSHIMFCVSFVALTVKARLRGFDWTLEDAAMDLGSPPMRTFVRVTFPLIVPGIMAAALLASSLSIDDFIITSFTSGQTVTFPLRIAGAFQREISPQVNVLATMILLASVTLLGVGTLAKALRRRH